MQDYLSSRSRLTEYQRCPRSRYLLHEAFGSGWELVRQSVPLVTGGAGHLILADLLRGRGIDEALGLALESFDASCASRGLKVKELEDQSLVYKEQRALIEGVGRLAAMRVVPSLLATYEVLEVEKMDQALLWEDPSEQRCEDCGETQPAPRQTCQKCDGSSLVKASFDRQGIWRSIPDALLRHRESGDLYILSWKIPAELPRENDARCDMQGLSETWALEQRLARWLGEDLGHAPNWFVNPENQQRSIRGVQMCYLLKGRKVSAKDENAVEGAVGKSWRHNSPLIWGYRDQSFPPKLAWGREWRCSSPHPMRKSKWYPQGECPGDGRNHRRGDDWQAFAVWEAMGIAEWLEMLAAGDVTPEAGSALDYCWSLPVPNFRPAQQVERWHRQTLVQERQIAQSLDLLRIYEEAEKAGEPGAFDTRLDALDRLFPQHTEKWCNDTYGQKCPAWEICWGPDSTAQDPLASGLYQVRVPYRETPEPSEAELAE